MIKELGKFARRYKLIALLFLVATLASTAFYWHRSYPNTSADIPPAKVIIDQAIVIDQGVQITWLEAQPGTRPISGYVIERKRADGDFTYIAYVENVFSEYLDAEGQTKDVYRVIAEDNYQPGRRSPVSEHVVAEKAKDGNTVARVNVSTRVLGASTIVDQAETPDAKADVLQKLITQTFTDLDNALANANTDDNYLDVLQNYQRQALVLWPQLSSDKKTSLAYACATQLSSFGTNLYKLPQDKLMDGMLVLAGCNAIVEGAE